MTLWFRFGLDLNGMVFCFILNVCEDGWVGQTLTSVQVDEMDWLDLLPFCLGGVVLLLRFFLSRYIMENALHVWMDGWIGVLDVSSNW